MMGLLEAGLKVKEKELETLKSGFGEHVSVLKEKNENTK